MQFLCLQKECKAFEVKEKALEQLNNQTQLTYRGWKKARSTVEFR